jgi:protein-disulfide isomerase
VDPTQKESQRRRRLLIFGGGVLVAVVVLVVVIAAGSGGSSKSSTSSATTSAPKTAANPSGLKGIAEVQSEFAGIPQNGNVLGNPNAKGTMMVFADLQCPFCAEFENKAFPAIVQKYVRPGKLKVVFQPIVIIGNDSILGARAAASAAQQHKLYEYVATVYRNQGQENSGYLNQDYVKKIGGGVSGLDVNNLVSDLKVAPVNKLLNDAQAIATSGHVTSTPSFFIAKTGQPLQGFQVTSLEAPAFYGRLNQVTR